ncbi:MAG: 5-guanidino-2-oxopentanoate decarboxylase [Myxococcales bacterium]|nr:5-guanidino-2-oxopentanoate decarboxylase [Myxococcales bacterium]
MATCGEKLIQILESYRIELVFGIPGVHTVELYRGLKRSSIRHITPRHEQGAGFMADGYARATGAVGVCFIITGPGMTNIATAMAQARQDSIPMLVISTVSRSNQLGMGEGRLHELPHQRNLVAEVAVFSHTLFGAEELPKVMARAFGVFASQRPGPVHIEIPLDVIASEADSIDTAAWSLPSAPAAPPETIDRAAALLRDAQRPLIAIGGGAIRAGAEVMQLAETLGAPVVNTVNAKGVVPSSHPLSVGGSGSSAPVRGAFRDADIVLGVGTEFAETDYDLYLNGDIAFDGKLIRIDIDAAQLSRNLKPHLAIYSDARHALAALNASLEQNPPTSNDGESRAQAIRDALHRERDERYQAFFDAIRDTLPEAIIAGDSTQPTYYACLHYETDAPRRYFHSASGYGTLGYAIPAAIGAKLGRLNQPVIALIGDGAAQFTLGEIASAVGARASVIFLIWNNQGYAEIQRCFKESGVESVGVELHTPDFVALGKSLGCSACRASNLEELKNALKTAAESPAPTLIEVRQADFVDGYAPL